MMTAIAISIAMTALLFGLIAMIFAFLAWSTVIGMKNSTHRIQYVPVKDPEFNQYNEGDLTPELDEETGLPKPINGGDETTGLGLLNAFKKNIHTDEED